jgi:hypothetical protein
LKTDVYGFWGQAANQTNPNAGDKDPKRLFTVEACCVKDGLRSPTSNPAAPWDNKITPWWSNSAASNLNRPEITCSTTRG